MGKEATSSVCAGGPKGGRPMHFYVRKVGIMNERPNAHAPLGQGGRFAALKEKLSKQKGVTDPGALAAAIGRKKYGAKKMASMAAKGH